MKTYQERYLEHYGVKGMRWGHRKDGAPQGTVGWRYSKSNRRARKQQKLETYGRKKEGVTRDQMYNRIQRSQRRSNAVASTATAASWAFLAGYAGYSIKQARDKKKQGIKNTENFINSLNKNKQTIADLKRTVKLPKVQGSGDSPWVLQEMVYGR